MSAFTIVPKGNWKSYGSEKEIAREALPKPSKKNLFAKLHFSAKREVFLSRRSNTTFVPKDAMEDGSSFLRSQNINPIKDPWIYLHECDVSVQAVKPVEAVSTQTPYFRKVHASIQAQPTVVDARITGKEDQEMEPGMKKFFNAIMPRMMNHLLQSEKLPIFADDYEQLSREDTFVAGREENFLREVCNHTHHYTRGRQVTSIDWKPQSKSIVVVTTVDPCSLATRLDNQRHCEASQCVVWSFTDQASLQYVLEAPCEVLVAKFCPTRPHLIVGGLINGQVCVWNLRRAPVAEEKDTTRRRHQGQYSDEIVLKVDDPPQPIPGHVYERSGDRDVSRLQPIQLSRTESAHRRAVHDIQWLPDMMECNFNDFRQAPAQEQNQFVTVSEDGSMLLWDLRPEFLHNDRIRKLKALKQHNAKDDRAGLLRGAEEEKIWVPLANKFALARPDGSGDVLALRVHLEPKAKEATAPSYNMCCTSLEGEFCECNWSPKEERSGGAGAMQQGGFGDDVGGRKEHKLMHRVSQAHAGPAWGLHQHPFFPDYYLTVGDWGFKIWKKGLPSPILASPTGEQQIMSGRWSPTRSSLVFTGTADGFIQVWDLLDRSHEPILVHQALREAITVIEFRPQSERSREKATTQQVALGSKAGTLHLYELPRVFVRSPPGEHGSTLRFFEREARRVAYFQWRWKERQKEADMNLRKEEETGKGDEKAVEESEYEFTADDDEEFRAKVKELRSSGDDDDDELNDG